MGIIITEVEKLRILSLYNVLTEQSKVVDTPGKDWEFDKSSPYEYQWSNQSPGQNVKVGFNNEKIRDYEQMTKNIDFEFFLDNLTDIISAALEGIPGIGNLGSSVLDITHSLSFFVRAYVTKDEDKKFKYIIDGITTGFMATLPFVGNVMNIGIRATIKKFLNMTHSDVAKWLKNNGINIKSSRFLLNKNRFVYAWLAALNSYTKDKAAEFLTDVENYANSGITTLEKCKELLNNIKYLPFVGYYINSVNYVINFFKELKEIVKDFEPIRL